MARKVRVMGPGLIIHISFPRFSVNIFTYRFSESKMNTIPPLGAFTPFDSCWDKKWNDIYDFVFRVEKVLLPECGWKKKSFHPAGRKIFFQHTYLVICIFYLFLGRRKWSYRIHKNFDFVPICLNVILLSMLCLS